MILTIDTSILIDLERGNKKTIEKLKQLVQEHPLPPRITFITDFEFRLGLQQRSIKNKVRALEFLNNFSLVIPSRHTSQLLANLKWKYDTQGIPIALAEFLIATLVIENNLLLVTRDQDFKPIEELQKIIIE